MSILIIINDQPSSGKTWNALRLSAALVGKDEEVEIFLMNDGVFNVMKNQKAPTEIEGQMTSHKIKELISLGVKFFYCSQCLETRGIEESQIADNVEKSNLPKLADFIKKSEKVITF
tara:strand:+ start:332 stop:682 length:351 start_codon:yes stop_codon:yes gene_type:complete